MNYNIIHNTNKVIWIEAVHDTSTTTVDLNKAKITRTGSVTYLPAYSDLQLIETTDKNAALADLENQGIDTSNYNTNEETEETEEIE